MVRMVELLRTFGIFGLYQSRGGIGIGGVWSGSGITKSGLVANLIEGWLKKKGY